MRKVSDNSPLTMSSLPIINYVFMHRQSTGVAEDLNRGMLYNAAKHVNIELTTSFMIREKRSDVQAGKTADWVTVHTGEHCHAAHYVAADISQAVEVPLQHCAADQCTNG